MSEERYDLKDSKRSVRELYPVILDANGNVIDGYHRLRADPTWRTEKLEHINTPTKLALARIIANTHRRSVSREEREEQINELARSLIEDEGVAKEEIISTIADLTTFSDDYIRRLLSDDYKIRPGVGGGAHDSVGLSPTQEAEFSEQLRRLGVTLPAGRPEPPGAEGSIPEPGGAPEAEASATQAIAPTSAMAEASATAGTSEPWTTPIRPSSEEAPAQLGAEPETANRESHGASPKTQAESAGERMGLEMYPVSRTRREIQPPAQPRYEASDEEISKFLTRFKYRYDMDDRDRIEMLQDLFGLSKEEAKRKLDEFQGKKPTRTPEEEKVIEKHEKSTGYRSAEPETCTCPLCGRTGADRGRLFLKVEELGQTTLGDFVKEAFK